MSILQKRHKNSIKIDSEKLIQAISECSEGIGITNDKDEYIYINDAFAKMLAFTKDEIIGMKCDALILDEYDNSLINDINEKLHNPDVGFFEGKILLKSKDEKKLLVQIRAKTLWNDHKKYNGHICVVTDITDKQYIEEELKISKDHYRAIFMNSPISLWEDDCSKLKVYLDKLKESGINDFQKYFDKNPDEVIKCLGLVKIIDVNRASFKLYKAKNKEELLSGLEKIFTSESYDVFKMQLVSMANGETHFEHEAINRDLEGKEHNIILYWNVAPGFEDTLAKVYVSILDISDQKENQASIEKLTKRYQMLFDSVKDAIFVHTVNEENLPGNFIEVNEVACERYGYTEEELMGLSPKDIDDSSSIERIPLNMKKLFSQKHALFEQTHVTKKNVSFPVEIHAHLFELDGKPTIISVCRDISERKKIENEKDQLVELLRYQAEKDGLTGIYNRQYLDKKLKNEVERAQRYQRPLSIIMLDLDNFKEINDNCGHQIGDKALKDTTNTIQRIIRKNDFVGRYGGEEFLAVCVETDLDEVFTIAERIRQAIEQIQIIDKNCQEMLMTASLGVAQLNEGEDEEDFVKRADDALYVSKGKGRNKVYIAK